MKTVPVEGDWRELKATAEKEQGIRIFETQTGYQPLTQISIKANNPVYHRNLELWLQDEFGTWKPWAKGEIFQLHYQSTATSQHTLPFPEVTPAAIQIRIHTQDRPHLKDVTFQLNGPQWNLQFLGEPGTSYRLRTAETPTRNPSPLLRELISQGHTAEQVTIGEPLQSDPPTSTPSIQQLISSKGFLFSSIAITALVISVALRKAVQQVESET